MNSFTVIAITLLGSAFFSGIEIAFLSASKFRLELKSKQGSLYGKIFSPFLSSPSRFISTILIGNNICIVVYSIFMENNLLHPYFINGNFFFSNNKFVLVLIETFISTIIILFAAEFLPKAIFRINPDAVLQALALPFLVSYYILYPFVEFISWLAKHFITGFFKLEWKEGKPDFSKIDLDHYMAESDHSLPEKEKDIDTEIFRNALDFGNVKVRECMIPRTEMVSIDVEETVEKLRELFASSGHSKLIVYSDDIEHIIGYVHHTSLFKKPKNIRSVIMNVPFVPESMSAQNLLNQLTQERKSVAIVVDEFGGTSGMVTAEDLLEEIFGEIKDEYDKDELTEQQISETDYIFSARTEIDFLNEKYKLNLPIGEYETLGGYLSSIYGDLPQAGETIVAGEYEFYILSVEDTRIKDVRILKIDAE